MSCAPALGHPLASDGAVLTGARSAGVWVEVIGALGSDPWPLQDRPSIGPVGVAGPALGPAGGRVLPRLLPAVDGQVEHRVAVVHGLHAATVGPVGLIHSPAVSQVADQEEFVALTPCEQLLDGVLDGV